MTKVLLQAGADACYQVPAGRRWDGVAPPERGLLDYANSKHAESIIELLKATRA